MSGEGKAEARLLEPLRLLQLVERDVTVRGTETPVDAIKIHASRDPSAQMRASEPVGGLFDLGDVQPPPDPLGTSVLGRDEFVRAIASLPGPARLVSVQGMRSQYVFLLDADLSRIVATLAVDVH